MESRQISLVQENFENILPFLPKVMRVLYDRLFEIRPGLKPLFNGDRRKHRKVFINDFIYIIKNLRKTELVAVKLKKLSEIHSRHNFSIEDRLAFKEAFLFAIAAALGNDFDASSKAAWEACIQTLLDLMHDYPNRYY